MSFEPDIFYDFTLLNLGEFLKENLNERGIQYMSKYPERFIGGYPNVVETIQLADQLNIATYDFPLLKIYRMSCESKRYSDGNGVRTCNVVIEYCLEYPNLNQLPNLLNWTDFHIQQLLLAYEYTEFPTGKPVQNDLRFVADRSEYRTGISPLSKEEYPFLRFIIRLRDDACPTPRNKDQFNFENCI